MSVDLALFGQGSAWSGDGLSQLQPGEFPTPCAVFDTTSAARFGTDFTIFSLATVAPPAPSPGGGPAGRSSKSAAERRRIARELRASLDRLRVKTEAMAPAPAEAVMDATEAREQAAARAEAAQAILARAQELGRQAASSGLPDAAQLQTEAEALEALALERMRKENQIVAAVAAAWLFL